MEAALRAADVAEASARGKAAFLSTISHELRNPLNAVLGMTQVWGWVVEHSVCGKKGGGGSCDMACSFLSATHRRSCDARLFPLPGLRLCRACGCLTTCGRRWATLCRRHERCWGSSTNCSTTAGCVGECVWANVLCVCVCVSCVVCRVRSKRGGKCESRLWALVGRRRVRLFALTIWNPPAQPVRALKGRSGRRPRRRSTCGTW